MGARYWLLGLLAAALFAFSCGDDGGGMGTGDAGGSGTGDGGGSGSGDGGGMQGCTVTGTTQCSDCIDNDMDGKIDGFDPMCTGPLDNREDSFATGIPGDNMDATDQDCFFDGNSGQGGDCNQHVCCLLQAKGTPTGNQTQLQADQAACAELNPAANASKYNPAQCYPPFGMAPVPSGCTMNCGPLAPPGCDCFGCCTVCNDDGCRDILLNPAVSPNCTQTNITDPGPDGTDNTGDEPCKRCVKNPDCGSPECGDETCILCPGQSMLPPDCMGDSTCPEGITECAADGSCPTDTYCQNGCCIGILL